MLFELVRSFQRIHYNQLGSLYAYYLRSAYSPVGSYAQNIHSIVLLLTAIFHMMLVHEPVKATWTSTITGGTDHYMELFIFYSEMVVYDQCMLSPPSPGIQ